MVGVGRHLKAHLIPTPSLPPDQIAQVLSPMSYFFHWKIKGMINYTWECRSTKTNTFTKCLFFFLADTKKHKFISAQIGEGPTHINGFLSVGGFVPALPEVSFSFCWRWQGIGWVAMSPVSAFQKKLISNIELTRYYYIIMIFMSYSCYKKWCL